jgi:hypothetical protein
MASSEESIAITVSNISELVRSSEIFYWEDEIGREVSRRTVINGVPVLDQPFYRMFLPAQCGLYWFESPMRIRLLEVDGRPLNEALIIHIRAVVWDSYGRSDALGNVFGNWEEANGISGMTPIAFVQTPDNLLWPFPVPHILEGADINDQIIRIISTEEHHAPNGFTVDDARGAKYAVYTSVVGFIWHSTKLLREWLEIEMPEPDRKLRKQISRYKFNSGVRVIQWRKVEYQYPEGHESEPVDWSCHWSVKSHPRTYKKTGRTIQVPSHVKGNLLAPYKPPAEVEVNVVNR